MELLPLAIREKLPKLYSQEHEKDPKVFLKFFTPDSNWTWFVLEGQPENLDFLFFGYVIGFEEELGYFLLSELESVRGPFGLKIERDLYFTEGQALSLVLANYRKERGQ